MSAAVTQDALFASTCWTLVRHAGRDATSESRDALEKLCRIYWPPIYSYLRRAGHKPSDAQDLTQSFFQHLLENQTLHRASREKGRFRSFLFGALKLCLADEKNHRSALKRGGGAAHFISLEALEAEEFQHQKMSVGLGPDECLDARWAGALLERAIASLRAELTVDGKAEMFEILSPFLAGDRLAPSYEDAAHRMKIGLGAVKSLIHRLRRQFAENLRREITQTVSAPHEVENELRDLRKVFARG